MMKKLNAAEISSTLAKAGDLVKGPGKGDMTTGAMVIIGGAFLSGAAVALGLEALIRAVTKD